MGKFDRYTIGRGIKLIKTGLFAGVLSFTVAGCSLGSSGNSDEAALSSTDEGYVDFDKLSEEESDAFAWIRIPDTAIDYPIVQSSDGDDSFYINHNSQKEQDEKGAIYIEAANMKDMCDFNEVIHGSSPSDGTMFAPLRNYLDKTYFDENPYVYIYMKGNALIYYVFAAYTRDDGRLLEEYDFSYASGCQAFLDEVYSERSMNKLIRIGWEGAVQPENFLVTLTTTDPDSQKQIVVIGCLVGDVAGKIDRYVDYSDPDDL